jgi:predicted  nucleic acid-binding Zn-ribbon protein
VRKGHQAISFSLARSFFFGRIGEKMTDLRREVHLLISIAKLDASISKYRNELDALPSKIERVGRSIQKIDSNEKQAIGHFEEMNKEKRNLEQSLEDEGEQIQKYRTQLMSVKTNKEYQAMSKEIDTLAKDIDEKEEKLLILMDEIENQEKENKDYIQKIADERTELGRKRAEMEQRLAFLKSELENLGNEKPKFLDELDPQLHRRYRRIIEKLGDFAVTHVEGDVCQGCFTTIPPQTINEVKKNDRIITCEACGRMLVYYNQNPETQEKI